MKRLKLRPESFARTDLGQAEYCAELYRDLLRFNHRRRMFLIWTPAEHRWRPDEDGAVTRLIKDAVRARRQSAFDTLGKADDVNTQKEEVKFTFAMETNAKVNAVRTLLQDLHPIADRGDGWDSDPFALVCSNGVVDLRTGELRDGQPEDRNTKSTNVTFKPDATAPYWCRFLEQAIDEKEARDYLQRFLGYSLSADVSEHAMLILFGDGGGGKSTVLNTVRSVAGDYCVTLQSETLLESGHGSAIQSDLSRLPGRRIATSVETADSARLDVKRIKALTGGESSYAARDLYKPTFEFTPVAKVLLATNSLPTIRDESDATWQRLNVVRFPHTFRSTDLEDKDLPEKLRAEAEGVLAWMVAGAREWWRRRSSGSTGLEPPDSVLLEVGAWKLANDRLEEWYASECTRAGGVRGYIGDLRQSYYAWTKRTGVADADRLNEREFGRRIQKDFPSKQRDKRGIYHEGIALVSTRGVRSLTRFPGRPSLGDDVAGKGVRDGWSVPT